MPNQTVNKVQFGGQTVMDITDTTADAADVIEGEVFYSKSGARSVGSLGDATQSTHGLMSTSDKIKLDGIIDLIYPIGSIYLSVNNTSPATLFGGTWEQIEDKFLLSAGSTYIAGDTGGAATKSYTPAGQVGNTTLTVDQIPSHNHSFTGSAVTSGENSVGHTHSVGAHSHGLNSHTHSVGAHSHGLNSHKHSIGAHSHGLNSHVHGLNSHTHTGPSHSHTLHYQISNGSDSTSGYALSYTPSGVRTWKSSNGQSSINTYMDAAGTGNTGAATGNTAAASGSTANSTAFDSGAASGSTANSTAFNTGAASGNTANSTAFNSGGVSANHTHSVTASGSIGNKGGGNAHNHGFTGTATTIDTMPPYLAVYMWKRTA